MFRPVPLFYRLSDLVYPWHPFLSNPFPRKFRRIFLSPRLDNSSFRASRESFDLKGWKGHEAAVRYAGVRVFLSARERYVYTRTQDRVGSFTC